MADGRTWRVFLSHTGELAGFPLDRSFVQAAKEGINGAAHAPIEMADFPAADQPAAAECAARVRSCDVYVGVLGRRYGSRLPEPLPDGRRPSYTEYEFELAGEHGLPRLMFLLDDDAPVPRRFEDRDTGELQDAFRERAGEGRVRKSFSGDEELRRLVSEALANLWLTGWRPGSAAALPAAAPVPSMVPVVPRHLTPRPVLTADLTARLLADDAGVIGVHGTAGFGKTTLVQVACDSPAVAARFPGGVLWVTIGEDVAGAALAEKINDLSYRLAGQRPLLTDPEQAGFRVGELLAARPPTLLVIDDVWAAEQLRPLLAGGGRCVRLVTTRMPRLLPRGADRIRVDRMDDIEARAVLTRGLVGVTDLAVDRLLASTGRWPLLLSLVNGLLLADLQAGADPGLVAVRLADRLEAEGPASVDLGDVGQRGIAVGSTLRASLDTLTGTDRERLVELGIFAEDLEIPGAVLTLLWGASGGLTAGPVDGLCRRLAARSLLLSFRPDTGEVRLHDVVRSYLRGLAGPERLRTTHGVLLDAAARQVGTGGTDTPWWKLPAGPVVSGYLRRNLVGHLVDAGRSAAADALARDPRWISRALDDEALGPAAAESDLQRAGTPSALRLQSVIARNTHLLAPLDPPGALLDTLRSRADEPGLVLEEPAAEDERLRLVNAWPPPDLPDPALVRVLTGHNGWVSGVAIAPDGSWLASTSTDLTTRIWDTSGALRATLTGHTGPLTAVAIAPDGTWLATASDDRTVRTWDAATGSLRATLTGHTSPVTAVAIAPDGTWLATTRTVRTWDAASGTLRATLTGHTDWVIAVAIAPDGTWLATTGHDDTVRIWDAASGTLRATLTGHTDRVTGVAIAPDGSWLATTSADLTARIWETATGTRRTTLTGHTRLVTAVAIAPDGTWLATTSDDKTVRVWGTTISGNTRTTRSGPVTTVAVAPDGNWLATTSDDDTVRIWDGASGNLRTSLKQPEPTRLTGFIWQPIGALTGVAIAPDGTWLATTGSDPGVQIWDATTGAVRKTLTGHTNWVTAVAIAPDCTWLATTSDDGTVRVWDAASGTVRITLTDHAYRVAAVAIGPDGTWLATTGGDNTVRTWDAATGIRRTTLTGHTDRVTAIAIAPDGDWLASASDDGTVRIWELDTGSSRRMLPGSSRWVRAVVVAPDGAWLASAGEDGTVRLWDPDTGAPLAAVRVDGALNGLAASPDGTRLAAVGERGVYLFRIVGA